MDFIGFSPEIASPAHAAACDGFHVPVRIGGESGGELVPCSACGHSVVRFGVRAFPDGIFGYTICEDCGFEGEPRDFEPASTWDEMMLNLCTAWNEANDVARPVEVPPVLVVLSDVMHAALGPLPEWRQRKCHAQ